GRYGTPAWEVSRGFIFCPRRPRSRRGNTAVAPSCAVGHKGYRGTLSCCSAAVRLWALLQGKCGVSPVCTRVVFEYTKRIRRETLKSTRHSFARFSQQPF
ncbi:unnamed protein product, partial [Phaeothamnion confervicola]